MNLSTLKIVLIVVAILLAVLLGWFLIKKTKRQVVDHVHLVTGGVKSGKTTYALAHAWKQYKRVHNAWKIKKFFLKPLKSLAHLFGKEYKLPEEPLFYSNIVLGVPFVQLTNDLLSRQNFRFAYKSVIFISETSLFADSYDIKDKTFNDNYSLFCKLIGHETHGGYLICETQALSDNHFALKRVLSRFTIITGSIKWLPFIILFKTRDVAYNADSSVQLNNVFGDDPDKQSRYVIVSKRIWKKFDAYTYSCFTDDLPVDDRVVVGDKHNLKTNYILEVKRDEKIK